MKTTCTECYGEPDLYHGCEDCGRPPRRHLIPADELAKLETSAILAYAAAHGYDFETASAAADVAAQERRDGETYWNERGIPALLDAVSPQKDWTFAERCDAARRIF